MMAMADYVAAQVSSGTMLWHTALAIICMVQRIFRLYREMSVQVRFRISVHTERKLRT